MQLTPEQFEAQLNEKLKELAELCAQHWGDAPELSTNVRPALLASCDFDLGDFPHEGRKFIIHPGNAQKRTPDRIARAIMQEVCSHRNQCDRCGLGIPPLRQRLRQLEYAIKNQDTPQRQRQDIETFMFPADEPERLLFPRQAKRLDAALAALGHNN